MGYMEKVLQIVLQARDEASKEIEKIGEKMTEVSGSAKKMQDSMRLAGGVLSGVGIAGFAIMSDWVNKAAEAQVQVARYEATLKNATSQMNLTTDETSALKSEIAKLSENYVNLAFDDETTQEVMAKNMLVTKDLTQSKKMLEVAMDLARQKGIGLMEAQQALQNMFMGNDKVAKQLGLTFDETASKEEKLDQVGRQVAGNASEYSKTWAGQMEVLGIKIDNIKEKLGERLLPELVKFADKAIIIIDKINELDPRLFDLAVKLTAVATAFGLIGGPMLIFLSYLPGAVNGTLLLTKAIGGIPAVAGAAGFAIFGLVAFAAVLWSQASEDFKRNVFNMGHHWEVFKDNMVWVTRTIGDNIMSALRAPLEWVSNFLNRIIDNINWVIRTASGNFGSMFSSQNRQYADGGYVPSTGPAIVHQGEYVLSNAMLGGRQSIDSRILAALGNGGGRNVTINLGGVSVNNKSDADYLVSQLSYQLRSSGGM